MNTNSKVFEKYWPFLDLFNDCTFHFLSAQYSCNLLSESIWKKCAFYKNCLIVHNQARVQQLEKRFILARDTFDMQEKILSKQRHNQACIAQITPVKISWKDTNWRFTLLPYRRLDEKLLSGARLPDFIFLPVAKTFYLNTFNSLPSLWSVKLIFLDTGLNAETKIFVGCMMCDKGNKLVSVHFDTDLTGLVRVWQAAHISQNHVIHNEVHLISQLKQFIREVGNHYDVSLINKILFSRYNFSTVFLRWQFKVAYSSHNRWRFTAFGAKSIGFQFSIVDKTSSNSQFSFHAIISLVTAFSTGSVLAIATTFIVITMLMIKLQLTASPAFWMYSIAVEQESEKYRGKGIMAAYFVVSWTILTIFLRAMYTSELYTKMTEVRVPSNLPEGLEQLVNSGIKINIGKCSTTRLQYQSRNVSEKISEIERKVRNKTQTLSLGLLKDFRSSVTNLSFHQVNFTGNEKVFIKTKVNAEIEIFSILHTSDICRDRFSSRLLSMMEKHTIYESNTMPAFSRLVIITWDRTTFLTKYLVRNLAWFVEGGTATWAKTLTETFMHQAVFLRMRRQGHRFKNVGNFFTFASFIVTGDRDDISSQGVAGQIRVGPYISRQYFTRAEWFGTGVVSVSNLMPAWVIFTVMKTVSILMFAVEYSSDFFNMRLKRLVINI